MESRTRLIRRVPLRDMDTVKAVHKDLGLERNLPLLERINTLWNNGEDYRQQAQRANNFTYGDQWSDTIEVNGKVMTQRQYLYQTGNFVMQTNQIKSKVETIAGVLVKENNMPVCNAIDRGEQQYGELMTSALQANCNKNKMNSLYIKFIKDLCIGGLAVAKESYEYRMGRLDSWTDYCDPNCVFFESEMVDPRFTDMSLIGQFFDMSFGALTARFAKSAKDYSILKTIYPGASERFTNPPQDDPREKLNNDNLSFLTPADPTKCRVFEVWTRETKPCYRLHDTQEGEEVVVDATDEVAIRNVDAENKVRKKLAAQSGWTEEETPLIEKEFFIDEFWYCRFLAPDGTVIWEGESPYAGRQQPFSICATPFMEGRIVGYMNDAIDHNIAMNRAIVLQDWLIRTQAKGVTVVPKSIVPNKDYKRFARSWTSIDDIVFIDMDPEKKDLMPKTFFSSAQTFNASELLRTYSQLMENSTAVSGAIQGKTPYSGTSGTLYAQMTQNASTPIASLLDQFHSFMVDLQTRKMKNIAMFYDEKRFMQIAGNIDGIFDNANMNLNEVANIELDLVIKESTDTGVYRAIINDDAKDFLMNNLISFEEYLTITNVPYADKILQMRQARQAEIDAAGQGQMPMVQPQQ